MKEEQFIGPLHPGRAEPKVMRRETMLMRHSFGPKTKTRSNIRTTQINFPNGGVQVSL